MGAEDLEEDRRPLARHSFRCSRIAAAGGLDRIRRFLRVLGDHRQPEQLVRRRLGDDQRQRLGRVPLQRSQQRARRFRRALHHGHLQRCSPPRSSSTAAGSRAGPGSTPISISRSRRGTGTAGDCSDFSGSTSVYAGTLGAFPTTFGGGLTPTDQGGAPAGTRTTRSRTRSGPRFRTTTTPTARSPAPTASSGRPRNN